MYRFFVPGNNRTAKKLVTLNGYYFFDWNTFFSGLIFAKSFNYLSEARMFDIVRHFAIINPAASAPFFF